MSTSLPVIPKAGTKIAARDVLAIEESIATAIATIDDIDILEEWRAKAAALETYLRGKELQRPMLGAQRRVEARIGQLLGKAPGRGKSEMNHHADSFHLQTREEFRILARAFDLLTEDEWRKSRRALVALSRQKLGLIPETPPLPDGKFRCICADPPWRLDTGPGFKEASSGHDALDYTQLSVGDIETLSDTAGRNIADLAADDCHLYLWTTNRYVEASYQVARAWGFKPSVLLVWAKAPLGSGLGDAYRLSTEFILYARKGKLKERAIIDRTCFTWKRGKHSEKPDDFYSMVETVAYPPYVELFARKSREGWVTWGAEADAA